MQRRKSGPDCLSAASFRAVRSASYGHLTLLHVASSACPHKAGLNEPCSVRIAAIAAFDLKIKLWMVIVATIKHYPQRRFLMNNTVYSLDQSQVQIRVNSFVRSVYNWMAVGLALTGVVAFLVASDPTLFRIAQRGFILFAIGELALVFMLSARIGRMQAKTATGVFLLYARLNGVTFAVYAQALIASTFFVCALTFGALSVFGWVTKRDLTGLGGFMSMGLIGIIVASLVNLFIRSSGMQMIISYIGVLIFAGLTAYDTQTIKQMALSQPAGLDGAVVRKGAIIGALKLYLDFILMFQYLLYIFGGSRD
jgi:FtsH-binding integral membrane protein